MTSSAKKPTLCIDFDGVLHLYLSGWTSASEVRDGPVSGAMDFLNKAAPVFEIAIFSSRSGQPGGLSAMQDWLRRHLQERFGASKGLALFAQITWPTEKPSAKVTLDDRAITFSGVFPSVQYLLNFEPWNAKMKLPKAS